MEQDAMPGELVAGRYRLMSLLGQGGMGSVWRARDEILEREVALKQLRLPSREASSNPGSRLQARLNREARATARLHHPNIVTLHDLFSDESGSFWIVMEFIPGPSLDEIVRRNGPLPQREAVRLGIQLTAGISAAHAAGIVHRDIKPANILVDHDRAVLTDFGIAALTNDMTLTAEGTVIGTPAYMAPEQLAGHPASPATDMFAWGGTMVFAITGHHVFRAESVARVMYAILHEDPDLSDVPAEWVTLLQQCLDKEPARRPSASEVFDVLSHIDPPDAPHVFSSPSPVIQSGVPPQSTQSRGLSGSAEPHGDTVASDPPAVGDKPRLRRFLPPMPVLFYRSHNRDRGEDT